MLCSFCHKPIADANYKTRKRKRYHAECYEQAIGKAEASNNQKASAIKDATGEKAELTKYICGLYKLSDIPYNIEKQIENFVAQHGYTYSGIQKTLRYFYEIQKNSPERHKATIGIVPYVYDEARAFYQSLHKAAESNMDFIQEEKTVHIKVKPKDRRLPCAIDEAAPKAGETLGKTGP